MENHLKEILVKLAESRVEFVVGGGVACVLQGVERVTLDLDIAVRMSPDNLDRLAGAVHELKLTPRIPVSVADLKNPEFVHAMVVDKGALVFTLTDSNNPLRQLDIFLSPKLSFEFLSEAAETVDLSGTKILVASRSRLLEIKRAIEPPRAKDILDITELSKLLGEKNQDGL